MTRNISKEYIDEEIAWMELGVVAEGTIQPTPEQERDRLDEMTQRLGRGEYHTEIDWDHELKMLLARCVDGRIPEGGANPLAPNSAGGTESLFVADDLTTKRFADADGTTVSGYRNLTTALVSNGYVVGGHTDSHAEGEKSGCGANDKLPLIYKYIAERGDVLRDLTEKLGIAVSDDIHELITGNAAARAEFSEGSELFSVLENVAEEEFVDRLHGGHNEVIAAINKRKGTTLDRDALKAEFGEEYEAFNVDAWAFEDAAQVISLSLEEDEREKEIQQKVVALAYYNLATTLVLAGPKLRVVVVE
jgi:hypothetical protein